jgi:hypothetical protein
MPFPSATDSARPQLHDLDPIVVLKSLIIAHSCLLNGTGDRVLKAYTLGKLNFRVVSHRSALPQNVLRYARYMDKRTQAYARVGCDVIKAKIDAVACISAPEARRMSSLSVQDGLLKEAEVIESLLAYLLDALADFDREEDGDLINQALALLFRDLFHGCAALCESVISILGNFFAMVPVDGRRALAIYSRSIDTIKQTKTVLEAARTRGHTYAVDGLKTPSPALAEKLRDWLDSTELAVGQTLQLAEVPKSRKSRTDSAVSKSFAKGIQQVETVILPAASTSSNSSSRSRSSSLVHDF